MNVAAGLFVLSAVVPALAQRGGGNPQSPDPPAPGKPPVVSLNPTAAEAGMYTLDARHNALIARAHHIELSYTSVFFVRVAGTLDWNPADVTKSKVTITIDTRMLETNVPNGLGGGTFAQQISGPQFLDAYNFPSATFVSTKITKKDASHGTIEGDLTLHGVTKPVAISAELLGAGLDNRGDPRVAFTGTAAINRRDFGITAYPDSFVGDQVLFMIDAEFCKGDKPCN